MKKLSDAIKEMPPEMVDKLSQEERKALGLKSTSKKHPKAEDEPWRPVITCMETIAQEVILWLWLGYIALRKICLVEGDPSHGKTWLVLAVAAAVSRGWPLPDAETGQNKQIADQEPANVVYMTAEDGLGDTIKPRLTMLGADHSRIFVIEGQRQGDGEMEPVTMQNLEILRLAMKQIKPVLLIVDPLQGFLGAGVDMHRANETRPVLTGMLRLAEEFNCAVVIIRHLNKSSGGKAAYRGMGSIDFTAAARTVLLVGKDPDDPCKRVVIPTKCNIGTEGVPIAFSLTPEHGFLWLGKEDKTADDLLYSANNDERNADRGTLEDAKSFLTDILQNGPVSSQRIFQEAKQEHIKQRTLERAKTQLGVKAFKDYPGGEWKWRLTTPPTPMTTVGGVPPSGSNADIQDLKPHRQKTAKDLVGGVVVDRQEEVGGVLAESLAVFETTNNKALELKKSSPPTSLIEIGGVLDKSSDPWLEVGHEVDPSSREGGGHK